MQNLTFLFIFLFHVTGMAKTIILYPGQSETIRDSGSLWLEPNKIIKVTETKGGFSIKGIRKGSTYLRAGKLPFEIHVLSLSQERTYHRLTAILNQTLGLEIQVKDEQIQIIGRLVRWEDWLKLSTSCQTESCDYLFNAELSDELKTKSSNELSNQFSRIGLPPQKFLFQNGVSILVNPKSDQKNKIIFLAKSFGIQPTITPQSIDLAPLIKVQITVAEVKRSESLHYGLKWPSQYAAKLLPNTPTADSEPLTIQALEEKGVAKVLASPTILCRSGKSADFLAGGEFPIKIINFKSQDVVWKKHGILLKVSPIADFSGKMSILIETEVSIPDWANRVDGIPGLSTNRIQSYFDLSSSRTIALSGLIKSEEGTKSSGLPGLGSIPILGALFSSKDFTENRTELVVFVKPEVVSPGSLEAEQ